MLVPADKTSNYYSVDKQRYEKLMKDNVTATYKKSERHSQHITNLEAKRITTSLGISDRVDVLAAKPAYVRLKDH
ncbi:hypothetical protein HOLleu_13162 [Holothuria leucospilota]|uniref:Uncharacterized protein n=1 Tax=Holothuria leucospilota TaxID=206669 RepID=A0A9Q1CBE3_HOLLE|nr:hypothetical protein HOLleu_13162 [Holothuria leucospilota]